MTFIKRPNCLPPHVEDVLVSDAKFLRQEQNLREYLLRRVRPWKGPPSVLYDRLVRFTQNGSGYICDRVGIPAMSTGFWIPDQPLNRADDGDKVYYSYDAERRFRFRYVGTGEPLPQISTNSLLRVSLARWWRRTPEFENRCYLQLSGWFL